MSIKLHKKTIKVTGSIQNKGITVEKRENKHGYEWFNFIINDLEEEKINMVLNAKDIIYLKDFFIHCVENL